MNLFKSFQHKASVARNGFDLSCKRSFSSKSGQLIPCLCIETVPNDNFEIDLESMMRTHTFDTAAFVLGKLHYDFFFVPYSQLWHPFNQFIDQRLDKHSSNQKGIGCPPMLNLNRFIYEVCNLYYNGTSQQTAGLNDIHNYSFAHDAFKLLDILGYGQYMYLLKFQAWVDCCQAMEEALIAEFEQDGALRRVIDKRVNVFRIAAYNHIWYDFYRNKYFDNMENNPLGSSYSDYVSLFNFDDLTCTNINDATLDWQTDLPRQIKMLNIKYRQWEKDLFTSLMPSQQFGAVSSIDLKDFSLDLYQKGQVIPGSNVSSDTLKIAPSASSLPGRIGESNSSSSHAVYDSTFKINKAFDVLQLKKAEYLQQWKQNALRGGNMVDDNFKSHYGVEPYYSADENVDYLGSFGGDLRVNAVETTAQSTNTGNNAVGDLGANGLSLVRGNKISFKCRDFGLIMCICSYQPRATYDALGIDKANTLFEPFDFYTPEFQNIGLESVPVGAYEFQQRNNFGDYNISLGYAPSYYQYKTNIDKVHGELCTGGSLSHWVAPRKENLVISPQVGTIVRSISSFYINPNVYNNIFSIRADSWEDTDYLIHDTFFNVKAVRPMSVLGLPLF